MILVSDCITVVAGTFGVSIEQLLSDQRARKIARPRQVAMYLAHKLTSASLPVIGRAFHRDHTTVMHAIRVIEEKSDEDPGFAQQVGDLLKKFHSQSCANCRFWMRKPVSEAEGACRRATPQCAVLGRGDVRQAVWPCTTSEDWCGEWRPRIAAGKVTEVAA